MQAYTFFCLIHLIKREKAVPSTNCSDLYVTCDLTSCFLYRMPMVKSRNILFQGAGHSVSEACPANAGWISHRVQTYGARPPLQPGPSWNLASANTADALPGKKVLGFQLDRMSQCSLEYFNTSHLLNSLGLTLLQESLVLYTGTFLKESRSSCAKLTLCSNEELKHVIAPSRGRSAFSSVRCTSIDACTAVDVVSSA